MNLIIQELFNNQDKIYKLFSQKLIPDTKLEIIGVRVPILKNIAKKYKNTNTENEFLQEKHFYYEEWFLHGLLIGNETNFEKTMRYVEDFLPQIDNWAICDSFVSSLKIFKKNKTAVYKKVKEWILSDNTYTKRFAIVVLLDYFIDSEFIRETLTILQTIISDNYYVNMALAWFYSVALIKEYKTTLPIIESKKLPKFVHNKSIQKAVESFRIKEDIKAYLKSLKIK